VALVFADMPSAIALYKSAEQSVYAPSNKDAEVIFSGAYPKASTSNTTVHDAMTVTNIFLHAE
jgi:hypothetical protein